MLYVGIDVGGTNIAAGVLDEDHYIIGRASKKIKVPCPHRELCSQILDVAKSALQTCSASLRDVESIGIGIPGAVDRETGVVTFSSNLFVEEFKIKEMLETIVGKPVFVENDANAAAYGEFLCGSLRNCKNGVALTLGTGIGCGIILDGKLYRGANGAAGEVGHMTIEMGGRLCNCGRHGCWERYASATGLIQTTREYLINHPDRNASMMALIGGNISNIDGKTAFAGKAEGLPLAAEIVDIYIHHLGCGLVNVINLLDPDTICIGGGLAGAGDMLLEPLSAYVEKEKYGHNQEVQLCLAALGNDAGIIGAANLGRA
ncbi:MAG: ROK family protein [Oscillospiraceae bacterium]|nr:ROK family protein [Oscillospiraceae bacterium]